MAGTAVRRDERRLVATPVFHWPPPGGGNRVTVTCAGPAHNLWPAGSVPGGLHDPSSGVGRDPVPAPLLDAP